MRHIRRGVDHRIAQTGLRQKLEVAAASFCCLRNIIDTPDIDLHRFDSRQGLENCGQQEAASEK